MKIYHAKYLLTPKTQLNSQSSAAVRSGALLKLETVEGLTGYSDVFPWPEFGDDDLETLLIRLKNNDIDPMIAASLDIAHRDAEARKQSLSLFAETETDKIMSHQLITDLNTHFSELASFDFSKGQIFKVKMGRGLGLELGLETKALKSICHAHPEIRLRLDFNNSMSEYSFNIWFADVQSWLAEHIDFVEDPFYFEAKSWQALREKFGLRLACDFAADPVEAVRFCDVLVLKPVRQKVFTLLKNLDLKDKEIVITHCMDHPVGQAAAQAMALELKKTYPIGVCGLSGGDIYESTSYSQEARSLKDYGLGYTRLLEKENWQAL